MGTKRKGELSRVFQSIKMQQFKTVGSVRKSI